MAEKINYQKTIYPQVGETGKKANALTHPCGHPKYVGQPAEHPQLLCLPLSDSPALQIIGVAGSRRDFPWGSAVKAATTRSFAPLPEQANVQLIPGIMRKVDQISAAKVARDKHQALAELVSHQQATIAVLQEEPETFRSEKQRRHITQGQQLGCIRTTT